MNNTTVTEVFDLSVTQDVTTQIFDMTVTSEAEAMDPHCGVKDWNECESVRTWKNVHFSLTLTFDVITLFILRFLRIHRTFLQRIFLNILCCNILEAISVLMNDGTKIESCIPAGFGVQYFGLVQFLWVCSLTIYVSLILLVNKDTQRHEKRYRVICWVVPLVLALIPFLPLPADKPEDLVVPYFTHGNTSYGMFYAPAGAFCWVIGGETGHVSHLLRAIIWWVPVMTGVLVIFLMWAYLMIKGTRRSFTGWTDKNKREQRKLTRKYLRPMAAYGVASTVMYVFMMTDRIYTWVMNEPSFVARILHTIGYAGYGMVLCALFYILCGRKEFRKQNWIREWEYHKRGFLCRKIITQHAAQSIMRSISGRNESDEFCGGDQIEELDVARTEEKRERRLLTQHAAQSISGSYESDEFCGDTMNIGDDLNHTKTPFQRTQATCIKVCSLQEEYLKKTAEVDELQQSGASVIPTAEDDQVSIGCFDSSSFSCSPIDSSEKRECRNEKSPAAPDFENGEEGLDLLDQTLCNAVDDCAEIDNQNSAVGVVYEEEIAVEKKEKLHGEGIEPSDECLAPGHSSNGVLRNHEHGVSMSLGFVDSDNYTSKVHELINEQAKRRQNGIYIQSECMAVGRFGSDGGTLQIGTGGKLKLVIPEGALSATGQLIYMYIQGISNLSPSPKYTFSPVVECGPDGMRFEKAVMLTIPHSAADSDGLIMFTKSETSTDWQCKESRVIEIREDCLTTELCHFSPHVAGRLSPAGKVFETAVFTNKRSQSVKFYIMPACNKEFLEEVSHNHTRGTAEELGFVRSTGWNKFIFKPGRGGLLLRVRCEAPPMIIIKEWFISDETLMELPFQKNYTCSVQNQAIETVLQYKLDPSEELQDQHLVPKESFTDPTALSLSASEGAIVPVAPDESMLVSPVNNNSLAKPSPLLENPTSDNMSFITERSRDQCPAEILCGFHDQQGGSCHNCYCSKNRDTGTSSGYISSTPTDLTLHPEQDCETA